MALALPLMNKPASFLLLMWMCSCCPKGSGTSLRRMFLQGRGLNSSYAIFQDATGKAKERVVALGIAVGSGYLFETDFKKEVYSDLTGERGTLMGAIQGIFAAQYEVLRNKGHSPSEAFNETVEELTQSLMPLVAENGMDWMYANCSTTAQRGALDWWKKFRDATLPVFKELYESVAAGKESQRSIDSNSKPDYREKLEAELKELRESEMWQAGKTVSSLRPENQAAPVKLSKSRQKVNWLKSSINRMEMLQPRMIHRLDVDPELPQTLKKVVNRTPLYFKS